MKACCFHRSAHSIVDDDQELFLISRNTVYFPPTFPRPICAYSCNYASATLDNCYGVLSLDRSITVGDQMLVQNASGCGVAAVVVVATGGAFD